MSPLYRHGSFGEFLSPSLESRGQISKERSSVKNSQSYPFICLLIENMFCAASLNTVAAGSFQNRTTTWQWIKQLKCCHTRSLEKAEGEFQLKSGPSNFKFPKGVGKRLHSVVQSEGRNWAITADSFKSKYTLTCSLQRYSDIHWGKRRRRLLTITSDWVCRLPKPSTPERWLHKGCVSKRS